MLAWLERSGIDAPNDVEPFARKSESRTARTLLRSVPCRPLIANGCSPWRVALAIGPFSNASGSKHDSSFLSAILAQSSSIQGNNRIAAGSWHRVET
jgi:hypothetical protein